jgi:hypothetical protein
VPSLVRICGKHYVYVYEKGRERNRERETEKGGGLDKSTRDRRLGCWNAGRHARQRLQYLGLPGKHSALFFVIPRRSASFTVSGCPRLYCSDGGGGIRAHKSPRWKPREHGPPLVHTLYCAGLCGLGEGRQKKKKATALCIDAGTTMLATPTARGVQVGGGGPGGGGVRVQVGRGKGS